MTAKRGVSLRIYLVDGSASGPRIVEKMGWTGHALMCSRAQYPEIRKRPEFQRTGVYVLLGDASDEAHAPWIYIGEADVVGSRLDSHIKNKDEWTQFVVFTSKDGNLNKAHAKNIESRLVEIALSAKRSEVSNGNTPPAPQLSEAERADVENFLEEMLLIFPILGVTAFRIVSRIQPDSRDAAVNLQLGVGGLQASGQDRPDGFVVFAGSQATASPAPSSSHSSEGLRERLIHDGLLQPDGDSMRFTQDYVFNSSSQAGMLILGYPVSGPATWKDQKGRTLKQIQSASVSE